MKPGSAHFNSRLLHIAWRNLWRNRRRTLIMLTSIALGVWAMIFLTALMRGMVDQMIHNAITSFTGHVQLHHPHYQDDPSIENTFRFPTPELSNALEEAPVNHWTARLRVPAVIVSERDSRGIELVGVIPNRERELSFIAQGITTGRYLQNPEERGILLGEKMLERLNTRVGKRIVIMTQDLQGEVTDRGFRIVGSYSALRESQEEQFAIIALGTAQQFLHSPNRVSEVEATGDDYRNTTNLLDHLASAAPELKSQPWTQLNPYMGAMLDVMDGFVVVWLLVVFIALSFGLVNTLMMAVFERTREIGLLQALGLTPAKVLLLILLEALLLLVLGIILGNALAILAQAFFADGIDLSELAAGMDMFGGTSIIYPSFYLNDFILANCIVALLGVLACSLPAVRAARLQPVAALGHH